MPWVTTLVWVSWTPPALSHSRDRPCTNSARSKSYIIILSDSLYNVIMYVEKAPFSLQTTLGIRYIEFQFCSNAFCSLWEAYGLVQPWVQHYSLWPTQTINFTLQKMGCWTQRKFAVPRITGLEAWVDASNLAPALGLAKGRPHFRYVATSSLQSKLAHPRLGLDK